jgi:hypothetical protein
MAQVTGDLNANLTQAQRIFEEVRELCEEVKRANQKKRI